MPLEINEIAMRMHVSDAPTKPEERHPKIRKDACQDDDDNREELVDECVRRVLRILKTLGGR